MTHPSKVGHYCTTADGTLCRVTYIDASGQANLMTLEDSSTLTLPIAELRRVPDPRNQRPPIEGLPAERPRCAWCDRPLKPLVDQTRDWTVRPSRCTRRVFVRWRAYEAVFCTADCAVRFAGASYRGGYRRTKS